MADRSSLYPSPLEQIRRSWGTLLSVGLLLIIFGVICVIGNVAATFATVIVLGWLLLASGIVALVHAFQVHNWGGFLLFLLSAIFRGVTGFLLLRYPSAGAAALTLIVASLFLVGGSFRAAAAAMLKFPRWGWSMFSGIVAVILGAVLLAQMPSASLWFIGLAVGLEMIVDGWALVTLATAVRRLPEALRPEQRAA
jgi:uncharacterized membrane protein HdeD (DUF308 family)